MLLTFVLHDTERDVGDRGSEELWIEPWNLVELADGLDAVGHDVRSGVDAPDEQERRLTTEVAWSCEQRREACLQAVQQLLSSNDQLSESGSSSVRWLSHISPQTFQRHLR